LRLLGLSTSDTTSYPIDPDFTQSFNAWYRKAVYLIWKVSRTWEFDDSNFTTLPIATSTMVAGQKDYSLPSTALDVQRVEVMNDEEDFVPVKQIDKSDVKGQSMSEFYKEDGMPQYYDVVGNSIMLYPSPAAEDTTLASGLKLYLARDINPMTIEDTTQQPGILVLFHAYMAYGSALDYAISKNMNQQRVNNLRAEIKLEGEKIKDYYANRNRGRKISRFQPSTRSSI